MLHPFRTEYVCVCVCVYVWVCWCIFAFKTHHLKCKSTENFSLTFYSKERGVLNFTGKLQGICQNLYVDITTHITGSYIYIYIYIYVCVYVCVLHKNNYGSHNMYYVFWSVVRSQHLCIYGHKWYVPLFTATLWLNLLRNMFTLVWPFVWKIRKFGGSLTYRKTSNIRGTESPNLNVSRLVLQLSLPNPMKPGVKSRMKM